MGLQVRSLRSLPSARTDCIAGERMKYIRFLLVGICTIQLSQATTITNDREAYDYCRHNPKSYIAIIWPLVQGKDEQLLQLFAMYGTINYKKSMYLTPQQAYYLLKKAHPHISNMTEHVAWYFPPGTYQNAARIFVFTCRDQATTVLCKYAIRRLFNLDYRPVHINDTHHETVELAKFFFIKNKGGTA